MRAEKTLENISDITRVDTTINQIHRTMEALAEAAHAIQLLAYYLERHPDSLLEA
ncbi:MAG: hypothetical protein GY854_11450 [Deltaproteobacteria bacterium]|nr:hypothetical protein [Deltaproteobacteria bacterium]